MTTSEVLKASVVARRITGKAPRYGHLNPKDFDELEAKWRPRLNFLDGDEVVDWVLTGTIQIGGVIYSADDMITPGLVRFND